MKINNIIILSLISLIAVSCGTKDPKEELSKLEAKKVELQNKLKEVNTKISKLEEGLAGNDKVDLIPVFTQEITQNIFRDYFQVQGDVHSENNIQVPAEYSGVITKIYHREGEYVQEGTLLGELDNVLLIKQKEELLKNMELTNTMYERQKRLWDQKIGSEVQYIQAKNQKESLDKKLETVNEQLTKTSIYAPISGTIDEVFIKEGEIIQGGMPSFRIVQLSKLKLKAQVSEQYVADVSLSDSVMVEFKEIGESFNAKINAISQVIDPDSRTFTIEVNIPDRFKNIKPNMYGDITIFDYINPSAIKIPMNIVLRNEKGNFIFIAHEVDGEMLAERRSIEVGNTNAQYAEITDGLSVGEFIIIDGYQNLSNNQRIEILEN